MIATLRLDPARQTLIRSFMDAYLRLSEEEMSVYNQGIEAIGEPERKVVMEITNQWAEHAEKRAIALGEERGIRHGEATILLRQLTRTLGPITNALHDRITSLRQEKLEQLADAVLDFTAIDQLHGWLEAHVQH